MPRDQQVISNLAAAVAVDPASDSLRLYYASVLLDAGRAGEAMEHIDIVLARDPVNVEALLQATRACEALGDPRAGGYRKLATSLSTAGTVPPGQPATAAAEGTPVAAPAQLPAVPPASDSSSGGLGVREPRVTLADVSGFAHVKRRLSVTFLAVARNPELREALGRSTRGGLLLFGPPHCGKTFIARALAGELGAGFLAVDMGSLLHGSDAHGPVTLDAVMELARQHAPVVVFFDGIDAVGGRRRATGDEPGDDLVAQVAATMDDPAGAGDGIFFVGATDHPWDVDAALLQPGRFDRSTLVLPPDRPARLVMLKNQFAGRTVDNLDLGQVADRLDGYSGADIIRLCEAASWLAAPGPDGGTVRPINADLVTSALQLVEPTSHAWFEKARNFALFANQAGMYDDLVTYMRSRRML